MSASLSTHWRINTLIHKLYVVHFSSGSILTIYLTCRRKHQHGNTLVLDPPSANVAISHVTYIQIRCFAPRNRAWWSYVVVPYETSESALELARKKSVGVGADVDASRVMVRVSTALLRAGNRFERWVFPARRRVSEGRKRGRGRLTRCFWSHWWCWGGGISVILAFCR